MVFLSFFLDSADPSNDYPGPSTSAARESESSSISRRQTWSKVAILKVIDLHTENEKLFVKPGIKKISIWEDIAKQISKIDASFSVSGAQCE